MHQSTLVPSAYQGFGADEAPREPLQHWKNRTIYLTQDIVKATTIAQGQAVQLVPILLQAQVKVDEAKNLIALEEQVGQWTRFREERIDAALLEARLTYNSALQQAALLGIGFPSMTTWTQSPSESKGTRPPSAVPPVEDPAGTSDADPKPNGAPPGADDSGNGAGPLGGGMVTPLVLGAGLLGVLWFMGRRR